jgi:hypothetical protein
MAPDSVSTILSLVDQGIALEQNYKGMLLQGDEVDQRIQLWRDAFKTCVANSESMLNLHD